VGNAQCQIHKSSSIQATEMRELHLHNNVSNHWGGSSIQDLF